MLNSSIVQHPGAFKFKFSTLVKNIKHSLRTIGMTEQYHGHIFRIKQMDLAVLVLK